MLQPQFANASLKGLNTTFGTSTVMAMDWVTPSMHASVVSSR
jgi:hypothetical protein